jgi:hypothetical protein
MFRAFLITLKLSIYHLLLIQKYKCFFINYSNARTLLLVLSNIKKRRDSSICYLLSIQCFCILSRPWSGLMTLAEQHVSSDVQFKLCPMTLQHLRNLYLTRTNDLYLYELEQYTSNDDTGSISKTRLAMARSPIPRRIKIDDTIVE